MLYLDYRIQCDKVVHYLVYLILNVSSYLRELVR